MSKNSKARRCGKEWMLLRFGSAKQLIVRNITHKTSFEVNRFGNDTSGNFALTFALVSPILLGAAGLGIDVAHWELAHKNLQRAADSAAVSATIAYQSNTMADLNAQAAAIAASYNFTTSNGSTVTANRPPHSGPYMTNSGAVEVVVTQPQPRMFSSLFGNDSVPETGRAVAVAGSKVCVLALNSNASAAISAQGAVNVTAASCSVYSDSVSSTSVNVGGSAVVSALQVGAVGTVSGQTNIVTTNGIVNNGNVILDPYAGVAMPNYSGCNSNYFSAKTTMTIYPGVYCGGFTLNASANVTMMPGIYFMDQGTFTINGAATLAGSGVTIIFTSSSGSNFTNAKIAGGANVSLTAPTSGPTAGIVIFGDRSMPVGTRFDLAGGTAQSFAGATYLPKGAISYAGGASGFNGCSQVIGDTIGFTGGSNLAINCTGSGTKNIGRAAQLLE